jgi:hypothetical protein
MEFTARTAVISGIFQDHESFRVCLTFVSSNFTLLPPNDQAHSTKTAKRFLVEWSDVLCFILLLVAMALFDVLFAPQVTSLPVFPLD